MRDYQISGDLVTVLQNAVLYKPDEPIIRHGSLYFDSTKNNERNQYGFIVERYDTPLGVMYQILLGEEYWCISAEDIVSAGV